MTEEEYQEYRNKYFAVFGDDFPNMEVHSDSKEDEVKNIKKCLKAKQPAKIVFDLDYERNNY